jgi:hypothetical protein
LAVVGVLDRYDKTEVGAEVLRDVARDKVLPIEAKLGKLAEAELKGASESHLIALWDIIDNALTSFDFSSLYDRTDTDFRIRIEAADKNGYCQLRILNNGTQVDRSVEPLLRTILDAARFEPPDMVKMVKDTMEQLRLLLKKENPCQGLYRTARFLHDLDPEHSGYIEFSREDGWTVFKLNIPKWS